MRVTRLGWHAVNILARSHRIITRTMSHCLPSKGTVLRLFNIVVQWKFKGQLFTCTFSARRPQGISELFLHCANFSVSNRRQSATNGDYRRLSATSGDSRRRSVIIGMYTSGRGPKKVHLSASIENNLLTFRLDALYSHPQGKSEARYQNMHALILQLHTQGAISGHVL